MLPLIPSSDPWSEDELSKSTGALPLPRATDAIAGTMSSSSILKKKEKNTEVVH